MKKILTLFAVVGLIAFSSCEGPEGPPGQDGLIAEVFEVTNVSFTNANDYSTLVDLNPAIFNSDVILLYRKTVASNGENVWKLIPETYYFDDGTLNFAYNYNFTSNDISIYMDGYDLGGVTSNYRLNQTFRVVIVPGYFSNTAKSVNKEDYSDYNAVIKKYNIDDSNVKKLN